jgi:hypothetical protein
VKHQNLDGFQQTPGNLRTTATAICTGPTIRVAYTTEETTHSSKNLGVRSYDTGNAICEPRGIPDDASDAYIYVTEQWEGDGHSHSYFTLTELLEHDWSLFSEFRETLERMKDLDENTDNVRAVFFFDN